MAGQPRHKGFRGQHAFVVFHHLQMLDIMIVVYLPLVVYLHFQS